MLASDLSPDTGAKAAEIAFYDAFHPKWVAALKAHGISVQAFSDRAVELGFVGEKTIQNWLSRKTKSPKSGDYYGAVADVLKTFASLLDRDLYQLYVMVNHGWTRDRFWRTVLGRSLDVKGPWVLAPLSGEAEPNWAEYAERLQWLLSPTGFLNTAHVIGAIEEWPGQTAQTLNVLRDHEQLIGAYSLIYYQPVAVADMTWEQFANDLSRAAAVAIKDAAHPVLVALAGVERQHVARVRDLLGKLRGNDYATLVITQEPGVLADLGVAEQYRHDFRPPALAAAPALPQPEATAAISPKPVAPQAASTPADQQPPEPPPQPTPTLSDAAFAGLMRMAGSLDEAYAFSVDAIAYALGDERAAAEEMLADWLDYGYALPAGHAHGLDVFCIPGEVLRHTRRHQMNPALPKLPAIDFASMPSKLGRLTPLTLPYHGTGVARRAAQWDHPDTKAWSSMIVAQSWKVGSLAHTLDWLKSTRKLLVVDMLPTLQDLEHRTHAAKRILTIVVPLACGALALVGVLTLLRSALAPVGWVFVLGLGLASGLTYLISHQLARAWQVLWAEMGLR